MDRFVVPGVADTSGVDRPLVRWASRNGLRVELPGGSSMLSTFMQAAPTMPSL